MKNLVTISGPSCVGKTKIVRHLLSSLEINCREVVSVTTKNKQDCETEGVDYRFITREEFEKLISTNAFIEYNEYAGNYYGTLKSEVASRDNEFVILTIEINGVKRVRQSFNNILSIFMVPLGDNIDAQVEVLREGLLKRNRDNEASINERIEIAKTELEEAAQVDFFDKTFVNDHNNFAEAQRETLAYLKLQFPQCINRTQTT